MLNGFVRCGVNILLGELFQNTFLLNIFKKESKHAAAE